MTPSIRRILLVGLGIWTLLPFALLLLVSLSGGWAFPTLLGASSGPTGWSALPAGRLGWATLTSLGLALGTGALAALLGFPLGRALSRLRGWQSALGAAAAFLPVATPPLLIAVGLQYSFLRLGLGGSWSGVLLAHLVPAIGYTSLYFLGVSSSWNEEIERVAERLGASRLQTLVRVVLPLLRRPLAEAFVLGFLVSWAQVPLTLLIGQGRIRALPVEVLSWISAGQDSLAAAGTLLLILPPTLLLGVVAWAARDVEVVIA